MGTESSVGLIDAPATCARDDGKAKRRPPHSPPPADFPARFIELGWGEEICEYYRTHPRTIARWRIESDAAALAEARRIHVRQKRAENFIRGRARQKTFSL